MMSMEQRSNTPTARLKPKLTPLKLTPMYPQPQAMTAAIMEDTILEIPEEEDQKPEVKRTYSLSHHKPQRNFELPQHKPKLNRQKTLSGDSQNGKMKLQRTYTVTSNASSSFPADEFKRLFDRYDADADVYGRIDGKIPVEDFEKILQENVLWVEKVPQEIRKDIINSVDTDGDGFISQEEFLQLAKGRNIPGFNRRRRRAFRELLKQTVEFIVPYKYQYTNQYSCFPPPFFMLGISLIQIAVFVYNSYVGGVGLNGPVFYCSHLIFDPDKRQEVWRYLSYMFIHSGVFHAAFNILIQLVLGIPLEMVHGWWRVGGVYLSGVVAGSLWTNVVKPDKFLSGASGGVYALITAHLGTVIMNYKEMALWPVRVLVVMVVAITDVGVYVYDAFISDQPQPISYPAHISGAISGLLVGIMCLKNLRWETYEKYIWAASTLLFVIMISTAIIWSLAFPSHFIGIRERVNITCIADDIL